MTTRSVCQSHLTVHRFFGFSEGPNLVLTGAVHGNETCGAEALWRVTKMLDEGELTLTRGSVQLLPVANPKAYAQATRSGDRNLNRNLRPRETPDDYEDHIGNALCPLLAEADVLLDLHSFQGGGEPFALIGPENNDGSLEPFAHAPEEARLVAHLNTPRIVEGWMSAYAKGVARRQAARTVDDPTLLDTDYGIGTTEYVRSQGGYAVTLECGQHDAPDAPQHGFQAIMQTLRVLEMIDEPPAPALTNYELLKLQDVTDRTDPADEFSRDWKSFDPIKKGELIATRANGEALHASSDGFIVFPNTKAKPGYEWFYFATLSERSL